MTAPQTTSASCKRLLECELAIATFFIRQLPSLSVIWTLRRLSSCCLKGAITVLVDDDLGVVKHWLNVLTYDTDGEFVELLRTCKSAAIQFSLVYYKGCIPEIIVA